MTKRIDKRVKGKLGLGFILASILIIYLCSLAVIGSTYADPNQVRIASSILTKHGVSNMQSLMMVSLPQPTPMQVLYALFLTITPNQISFTMFHTMNDLSHGWLQSLFTIFLIEQIEILGIILYLRYKNNIDSKVYPL